ncbi:hypothetical protein BDQ17DRAFT_1429806 [Cyathus striatus]|nr:hypothetical protein BDQ17DRAFT_1429806 [Cyathus striatus]
MKPLGPSQELISRIHHLRDLVKNLSEVLPLEPATTRYNFFVDNDEITEYGALGAFSKCMEACFETYKHRGGVIEFTEGRRLESDLIKLMKSIIKDMTEQDRTVFREAWLERLIETAGRNQKSKVGKRKELENNECVQPSSHSKRSRGAPVRTAAIVEPIVISTDSEGDTGHSGILAKYPNIVEEIKKTLKELHLSGIPVNVIMGHSIMLTIINQHEPSLLTVMNWSLCQATCAAAHLPIDAPDSCERTFFCLVYAMKWENVPPSLVVNIDQMGMFVLPSSSRTYHDKGAKQVEAVTKDEKQAYSLLIASSADGNILPFQQVWGGKSLQSLPSATALGMLEALEHKFHFAFAASESSPRSHFSTLKTMKEWVEKILAWRKSVAKQWCLSAECLTSLAAQDALSKYLIHDSTLHNEIRARLGTVQGFQDSSSSTENDIGHLTHDDTDVPLHAVIQATVGCTLGAEANQASFVVEHFAQGEDGTGGLVAAGLDEDLWQFDDSGERWLIEGNLSYIPAR